MGKIDRSLALLLPKPRVQHVPYDDLLQRRRIHQEATHRSGRNLASDSHDKQYPRLRIPEHLNSLISFKLLILDPLFVSRDAGCCDCFLVRREEASRGGGVGEEEEGYSSPCCGYAAENQEYVLPFVEAGVDVADCVAEEAGEHCCDADG